MRDDRLVRTMVIKSGGSVKEYYKIKRKVGLLEENDYLCRLKQRMQLV